MPFFLESLGVKLAEPVHDTTTPTVPVVDPDPQPALPFISSLGFEVSTGNHDKPTIDVSDLATRAAVFRSFNSIGLFVEDTKRMSKLQVRISDSNNLAMVVPTVNHLCSKLHVEDISPINDNICNHDKSKCTDAHFDDDVLLIEPGDYLPCDEKKAVFRIRKTILCILIHGKWSPLGIKMKLQDGFYSLKLKNFD